MSRRSSACVLLALAVATSCTPEGAMTTPVPPPVGVGAIQPGPYAPGESYFGRNNYIEYVAGNAPLIYTAPHGGSLIPAEIPDRTASSCGGSATTGTDLNTRELALAMQARHFARFGNYPHVIINNLHRRKLDANRDIVEGACGDAEAQLAWNEFHDFVNVARAAVIAVHGKGWYMDMHGHGHAIQRLELGWLLSAAALRMPDPQLNASSSHEDSSSFQAMSRQSPLSFTALLRGANSLGALYAANNFPSVPSPADPYPQSGESYFSGGYNTARHGCGVEASELGGTSGGNICGVQIEAHFTGVRDTDANRARFGDVTAVVVQQFMATHWALDVAGGRSFASVVPVKKPKGSPRAIPTGSRHRE